MIRRRLRAWTPRPETLVQQPGLRWLAPLLTRPGLWHFGRREVAAGAAIGVFFGFLVPVLQILLAAVLAVALRANLPVAAAATLVSNPVTYLPIGIAAYKAGAAMLGDEVDEQRAATALGGGDARPWTQRLSDIGRPLALGLATFAVVGAALAWTAVTLGWRLAVVLRRRRGRRGPTPPEPPS